MIDLEAQRLIDTQELSYGSHNQPDDGMCAMEMVAHLAGEQHTDHPRCACPVLTGFTIRLNDAMPERWRRRLKPYLPYLIDTRDGREGERAELLAWHAVRVFVPIALQAGGQPDRAEWLRGFEGSLTAASDACYAAYSGAQHPAASAAAAYAAHAARAPRVIRAADASNASDAAIAAARLKPNTVWPLALDALGDAIAIGASDRLAAGKGPSARLAATVDNPQLAGLFVINPAGQRRA